MSVLMDPERRRILSCDAICPRWVLTPLVEKQINERASRENISVDQAKNDLLSEKQASHEFASPQQIGALTIFLCSESAAQMRGVAPVDGRLDCAIMRPEPTKLLLIKLLMPKECIVLY